MSETTDPRGRTAAEIENDVERTRARVSDTIEALRGSMSPNQIMDQVMDYARSSGGSEFIRNLGTSVRDNPLPVVLIGAGIGWLLLSNQNRGPAYPATARQPDYRVPALPAPASSAQEPGLLDRAGAAVASARDAVVGAASNATDAVAGTARNVADAVADTASSAGSAISSAAASVADGASQLGSQASATAGSVHDAARRQTHDATHTLSQGYDATAAGANRAGAKFQAGWGKLSHEQPLLVGALGLAVGAALGALLPSTEAENRLMGEASDAVTKQVSDTAQEQYAQVKDAVSDNVEQAKDALAGAYEDARDTINKDGLSAHSLGEGVKQAAARVADVATKASTDLADVAKGAVQTADTDSGGEKPASSTTPAANPRPAGLQTPTIVVPPKV
ncbi:DUF3618 domain-containing protein [Roseomonas haemaphysalidis]|uniref:DUF3618 domain-containing protein n=1 Tax=Roseomonas haemaphysalidis TaxID=2768162 RepID=A0ABS3KNR7_9PROT|nr:DUF3618 domain-containing protein [Roseomonas haemaphysalidis]MBO1079062.1 DUF3618 domain-containing protein [Roseomonas haemaphysalidis]